jgi:hypothetical protein
LHQPHAIGLTGAEPPPGPHAKYASGDDDREQHGDTDCGATVHAIPAHGDRLAAVPTSATSAERP